MLDYPLMKEELSKCLMEALDATYFHIVDDSQRHAGHNESLASQDTHFNVTIVSETFHQMSKVNRHREVNKQCKSFFAKTLHALSIKAYSPEEWEAVNE